MIRLHRVARSEGVATHNQQPGTPSFLAIGLFLVAVGAALGWYLRGDDVDDAYWSGYRAGLDALEYVGRSGV